MDYRRMKTEDRHPVLSLWQTVFGDTEEEASSYLFHFVGEEHLFVAEEKGCVCAILSAVPCSLEQQQGVYFFALATAKEHRGKGVMQALMRHTEAVCTKEGAVFCCLVPASHSLFSYYEGQGFETLYQRKLVLHSKPKSMRLSVLCLERQILLSLRKRHVLPSCITVQESALQLALSELGENGYQIAASEQAYAVFSKVGESLLVPELWAESEVAAQALLSALAATQEVEKAVVLLPKDSRLFLGKGVLQGAAQMKMLLEQALPQSMPRLYFALDALFEKDYDRP